MEPNSKEVDQNKTGQEQAVVRAMPQNQPHVNRPILINLNNRNPHLHMPRAHLQPAVSAVQSALSRALHKQHKELTKKMRLHRWAQQIAMTRYIETDSLRYKCDFNFQNNTLVSLLYLMTAIERKVNIPGTPTEETINDFWQKLDGFGRRLKRDVKRDRQKKMAERILAFPN